jgi:hypothetical protein
MYQLTCLDCTKCAFAKHYKTSFTKQNSWRVIMKIQHYGTYTLVVHMIKFSTLENTGWKMNVTENYTDTCTKKNKNTPRNNLMWILCTFENYTVCTTVSSVLKDIKLNFSHKIRFSKSTHWHFVIQKRVCNIQW